MSGDMSMGSSVQMLALLSRWLVGWEGFRAIVEGSGVMGPTETVVWTPNKEGRVGSCVAGGAVRNVSLRDGLCLIFC